MSQELVKTELGLLAALVEERLQTFFQEPGTPLSLAQAMRYSLLAGGKRLRPILCLSWAQLAGGKIDAVLDFACAIECIHTYSLIHDDLPAMDNDDLRRGQPANHKQFDEATAILAGDGLLTEAFALATGLDLPLDRVVAAMGVLAQAAGPRGMVGGQVLDMAMTGAGATLEELSNMHAQKTGALIAASCVTGAILGGGNAEFQARAQNYGQSIGLAFQVVDDILDLIGNEQVLGKPVGSDLHQGKATYPALLGISASRALAQDLIDQALASLDGLSHGRLEFLRALAQYIVDRGH